jgi:hypothetical protein
MAQHQSAINTSNSNYGGFVGARQVEVQAICTEKALSTCLAPTLAGKFRIAASTLAHQTT